MRTRKLLTVLLILLAASGTFAQSTKIRGRVMDSSGSVMPGVQVKIYQGDKVVKEGVSSNTGDFDIAVDPGEYKLEVVAPDFNPYTEVVKVSPDLGPLAITMELAQIAQNVEVTETRNELSIDPDSSLNTTVLGRDFIDALPDDEEELAAYLQQIAGSRGGAGGGGGFVIDGFTGGRIPPKDQIQEIRINNSPFSTEFSGIGYGRTEIITRAGTGDFRGNMNFNFRDESLNGRNAFNVHEDGSEAKRPPSQARNFNSNFNGPIIRNRLSLNLNARHNNSENTAIVRATTLGPNGDLVQHYDPVVIPNSNRELQARTQFAINKNNTLNTNFNYRKQDNRNQNVGDFNLIERASNRNSRSTDFQVRETSILSTKMVHEVRFQTSRDRGSQAPQTMGVGINVLDTFYGGGGQNKSSNSNRESEFGNLLMYSGKKWMIKSGFQGLYRNNHSLSENNFLGTWTFSSMADYIAGRPITFMQNAGDPRLDTTQFEYASFIQNDWRVSQKFNMSFGLRYEGQTNISDHNNFDPRMGIAYQIGKTTALRGGVGIFHQRFEQNNVEQLLRLDGTRQLQIVVRNPTTYPVIPSGSALPPSSLRVRSADLATPYNMNASLSLEQALPHGLGLTFSYDAQRGVHVYRSRNINAPFQVAPGVFLRPDPTKGNLNQLESTGLSRSHNFTLGFRQQVRGRINAQLFGNYTYGFNNNDTDGAFSLPANNYDLHSEWGRSPQDTRHRFFTGGQIQLPWGFRSTAQLNWSSSRPYNITTGYDDNFDTQVNDRPTGVNRNSGKGPGQFNLSMNLQKTIPLKREESAAPGRAGNTTPNGANPFANNFAGPQRGGGGGFPGGGGGNFPRDGGGGEGGQRGNFPGGQRGGGQRGGQNNPNPNNPNFNQGRGPTMTFQVQVQNLLNNTQFTNYIGTMTSQFFGKANRAQNPRQIEAGIRFNF